MAKRFTATEKWRDKWFRRLPPELKLGYLYLLDMCDHAGVIELDEELANFQIGCDVDWSELQEASEGRIERLPCGRLWLVKFCNFQYGKLREECKPHSAVISQLRKHGIFQRVSKGYPKGIQTLKDKEKDKEKEKDKDRGGAGGDEFERFWSAFPPGRKKSKAPAKKAWKSALTKADPEAIIDAAKEYAESEEGRGEYVKMPATWLNAECWEDDRSAWNRSREQRNNAAEWIRKAIEDDE